jgi:phage terminase large subunit-like protein
MATRKPKAETRGEKVIRFIETFCVTPEGVHVGKPIVLAEFQKKFLIAIFDNKAGTRRAILSVGRKSGKSTLVAGIVLASIVGPLAKQNSSCCVGAMSREQSAIIFHAAAKMVQLSPTLSKLVKVFPSGKRLLGLPLNVEFKALAADGKTAMGGSYSLVLIDEIGQIRGPQSDFVDSLVTSQGAYSEPLLIAISTRASNAADLFEQWIQDAETSKDPKIVSHVYSAPAGCDLMDESAWYAANPALGIFRSLDDLRDQLTQAARMVSMENSARNLLLNQVISTVSPFISPNVWQSCAGAVLPFGDAPVYGGIDLSAKTDLSALVLIGKVAGQWHVVTHAWTPEQGMSDRSKRDRCGYDVWHRQGYLHSTPGATVDYEFVAADMAAITAGLNIQSIAFDRWRIDLLKKELDKIGCDLPLIPMGQGFKDQSVCLDMLEAELLNGRINHGGHPVLQMAAANAIVVRDPANGRKLDKGRATGRIDPLAALANAFGAAAQAVEEQAYASDAFTFI